MRRRPLAVGLLAAALVLLVFVEPLRVAETRLLAGVLPGDPTASGTDLRWPEITVTLSILQSVVVLMIPWIALAGAVLFSVRLPVSRVLGTLGILLVLQVLLDVGFITATAWVLSRWQSQQASFIAEAVAPGFTQLIVMAGLVVGIRLIYGPVPLPQEHK